MAAIGETRKSLPAEIRPGVIVCPDAEGVARLAAARFLQLSVHFSETEGKFCVALAGGSTPRPLYRLLAASPLRERIPWSRVHLFWGDERAVPPEDPASNYGTAYRELLAHVPLPAGHVHRMGAEVADLDDAANQYANRLRHHLQLDDAGYPRFHLIVLGLGADGHTASLFPGERALENTAAWVIATAAPGAAGPAARRLTLTLGVLNAAHHVIFLVTGPEKAHVLWRVLEDPAADLPAQRVQPRQGERLILADAAAASRFLFGGGS
ncbi:MAG: 6-phosphogluconolactonase [Firmicutes bacterium]|nr:6-phosphogluconolactonase [Bacillota bacterium]